MDALSRAILESASDPTWIMTRDLVVTAFNAPFAAICERVTNVAPEAPVALDALVHEPEANAWWRDVCARVFTGRHVTADRRPFLDGSKRYFTISGMPVLCDDEVVQAVFAARDVTERSRADPEELFDLAVTRILTEAKPLEAVLGDVLEFVCESDGWDCAVIWLIEPDGQHLAPSVIWTRPDIDAGSFRERVNELRFARGRGIPGKAWSREGPFWVPDRAADLHHADGRHDHARQSRRARSRRRRVQGRSRTQHRRQRRRAVEDARRHRDIGQRQPHAVHCANRGTRSLLGRERRVVSLDVRWRRPRDHRDARYDRSRAPRGIRPPRRKARSPRRARRRRRTRSA